MANDIIAKGMASDNVAKIETVQKMVEAFHGGLHYKGAVDYFNELPDDAEVGDAYKVKYQGESGTVVDGSIYAWGEYEGTLQWIKTTASSSVLVKAAQNKTVNGYQVPELTDDQLVTIYNAIVAGNAVVIEDATGMMFFTGLTTDVVSDEIFVSFLYFNTMILEYGEGNVTNFKEIADKAYVNSAIYEVLNTEV